MQGRRVAASSDERAMSIRKQEKKNIMITKTLTFGGVLLLMLGLMGFAATGFMGMHLSLLHIVMLLLSGALAIYFGLKGSLVAGRSFCLVLGAVYGLLGLVGFLAGGKDYTFTIIPGALVLGMMDHVFNLILGTVFLSVGWVEKAVTAPAPTR
jgi:hypothetical protein